MSWKIITDLPVVDGYDLPSFAGKALAAHIRSGDEEHVSMSTVIQHGGKENKCARLLKKYGVVNSMYERGGGGSCHSHLHSSHCTPRVRRYTTMDEDFIQSVVKDMEPPEWDVSEGIEKSYLSVTHMNPEQLAHWYSNPSLYIENEPIPKVLTGYLPRRLVAQASTIQLVKDIEYLVAGDDGDEGSTQWVARHLYGYENFEYLKRPEYSFNDEEGRKFKVHMDNDHISEQARNVVETMDYDFKVMEDTRGYFVTVRDEAKKMGDEGFKKHLYQKFLDDALANAVERVCDTNQPPEVISIYQRYLAGVLEGGDHA